MLYHPLTSIGPAPGKENGKVFGWLTGGKFQFRSSLVTFGNLWSSPNGRNADEKALFVNNR